MTNTVSQIPNPRELFTRERRRTRMQDFLLRYEGTREQRTTTASLFRNTETSSVASPTRTVGTLSR